MSQTIPRFTIVEPFAAESSAVVSSAVASPLADTSLSCPRDAPPSTDGAGAGAGARDSGAVTAEYAIATMAAVGFAGLLVVILRSDAVRAMLTEMINRALTFAG